MSMSHTYKCCYMLQSLIEWRIYLALPFSLTRPRVLSSSALLCGQGFVKTDLTLSRIE